MANAFIPTMVYASGIYLLVLPIVVILEGWFLQRWGWQQPYAAAVKANALSTLAAIPIGVAFTWAGWWLYAEGGHMLVDWGVNKFLVWGLTGVLLYGGAPAPTYGFVGDANFGPVAFAAFGFIGLCWLITIIIEGWYLARKNPSMKTTSLATKIFLMHLASYTVLISMWVPFTYLDAEYEERSLLRHCLNPGWSASNCDAIWRKYPELEHAKSPVCTLKDHNRPAC